MNLSIVLFINVLSVLVGLLRFLGWVIIVIGTLKAKTKKDTDLAGDSAQKMGKGCITDFILVAWWITWAVSAHSGR